MGSGMSIDLFAPAQVDHVIHSRYRGRCLTLHLLLLR